MTDGTSSTASATLRLVLVSPVAPGMADMAAEYVRAGLALIPIPRGRKGPRKNGWDLEANAIRSQEQAAGLNGSNIGLAHRWCGTCAVDVDDDRLAEPWLKDHGIDLQALLAADDAVQITSGRPNRAKLLYRLPTGVDWLPTYKRNDDLGLEVRCADRDGAKTVQDVLPPSLHPDTGKLYEWAGTGDWHSIPTLPDALLKVWRELDPKRSKPPPRSNADVIREGSRNVYLASLAGTMRRRGMGQDAIEAALQAENAARCHPPLLDAEVRHIATSVMRYTPAGFAEGPPKEEQEPNWPEPQPLTVKVAQEPYPLDALPDTIRAAVAEVQGFTKAPMALVASSALGALSLAIQAYIDVRRVVKLEGPSSLFLVTIADSGERKTTCDGFFVLAIREYEANQANLAEPKIKEHAAAIAAWTAERDGILMAIRSAAKARKSTDILRGDLAALEHVKPKPPRVPKLLRMDDTPESLAWVLAKEWPSAGVIASEAGIVFGAHAMGKTSIMRNLALLNVLWDGGALHVGRRTSESFTVKGARLTVALQVQEATLRSFFDQSDGLARGIGFLARFLVAWPESTQGFRPFTDPPPSWPALAAFNRRIAAILETPVPIDEDGALSPAMPALAPDTKGAWVEYHDAIEGELRNGGELYDVRDVASKSADNAVRLAALFQFFEFGAVSAVGLEAFEGAGRIAAWHLNESRRFFGELALPVELADATRLDTWLIEYCHRERTHRVPVSAIQKSGPYGLRIKATMEPALRELVELDRVRLVHGTGKARIVEVNPGLLGAEA